MSEAISARDMSFLAKAFDLSRSTPGFLLERPGALAVGALLLTSSGHVFEACSGENGGREHAEEALIVKAAMAEGNISGSTLYVTHEPCGKRTTSGAVSCTQRILDAGIASVFYAVQELKPDYRGADLLRREGVRVVQVSPDQEVV